MLNLKVKVLEKQEKVAAGRVREGGGVFKYG